MANTKAIDPFAADNPYASFNAFLEIDTNRYCPHCGEGVLTITPHINHRSDIAAAFCPGNPTN